MFPGHLMRVRFSPILPTKESEVMASFFKEGSKVSFNGIKGTVIKITETYRKNVLVVKVSELPRNFPSGYGKVVTVGLFEYPDGKLEFMNVID